MLKKVNCIYPILQILVVMMDIDCQQINLSRCLRTNVWVVWCLIFSCYMQVLQCLFLPPPFIPSP